MIISMDSKRNCSHSTVFPNPELFQHGEFVYVNEHEMTPQKYIDELTGIEKYIFGKLYAGSFSKKLYRLFEYRKV